MIIEKSDEVCSAILFSIVLAAKRDFLREEFRSLIIDDNSSSEYFMGWVNSRLDIDMDLACQLEAKTRSQTSTSAERNQLTDLLLMFRFTMEDRSRITNAESTIREMITKTH